MTTSRRRPYMGASPDNHAPRPAGAWVTLVMLGDIYVPGALVLARSLRNMQTAYDSVCMVTDGVSANARAHLGAAFTHVVGVEFAGKLTKWACLSLTDYDKVVFVAADMLFLTNCDDLFDLRAPAACFARPGGEHQIFHGAVIPAAEIQDSVALFDPRGALVLLTPDLAAYRRTRVDDADAERILRGGADWIHIHPRYVAIPWKPKWVPSGVRAYHFCGRLPWELDPVEAPDWWKVASALAAHSPGLNKIFHPVILTVTELDADIAQLRLTNSLRQFILGSAGANPGRVYEADNILERWLLALVNSVPPSAPWAKVYRRSTLDDDVNNKLAGELLDKGFARSGTKSGMLVDTMLTAVNKVLSELPRPTRAVVTSDDHGINYGSHFEAALTPRIARLIEIGGCEKTVAALIRYSVVVSAGQQWGIPQAHTDHLYDAFNVRHEAFASPTNSRLLGKPDATFCSIFPDTDAVFGSVGDFFAADISRGNWVVSPPFVESIMERAATRIVATLTIGTPQTFFCMLPAWNDCVAYATLHECPFLAAELRLEPGQYYHEDPSGKRIYIKVPSIYFALSTESFDVRERLASALYHMTEI